MEIQGGNPPSLSTRERVSVHRLFTESCFDVRLVSLWLRVGDPTLDPPQKWQSQPLVAQLHAAFPFWVQKRERRSKLVLRIAASYTNSKQAFRRLVENPSCTSLWHLLFFSICSHLIILYKRLPIQTGLAVGWDIEGLFLSTAQWQNEPRKGGDHIVALSLSASHTLGGAYSARAQVWN